MSNQKDHTNKLKALLKKNVPQEADEFDKAALEGFALLENEEEAVNLKNSLDEKIYSEVFTTKKQESRKYYWLAAAALIGVIGFSVYFIQNYSDVKDSGLAIHSSPVIPKEEKAPVITDPVAVAEKKPEDKSSIRNSEKAVPEKNSFKKTIAPQENSTEPQPIAQTTPKAPEKSSEIVESSSEDKDEESIVSVSGQSANQPMKADVATVSTEGKSNSRTVESEYKRSKQMEKENAEYSSAPAGSGAGAGATDDASAGYNADCIYKGGKKQLKKDLSELLVTKKLLYKFDAILYLNKNAKVEKVKLSEVKAFNAQEQEQLTEILKGLDKFELNNTSGNSGLIEYKLEFRP